MVPYTFQNINLFAIRASTDYLFLGYLERDITVLSPMNTLRFLLRTRQTSAFTSREDLNDDCAAYA